VPSFESRPRRQRPLVGLTFAAILLSSTSLQPAWAQQQAADTILSPVTVTATKTAHSPDEVPANVTVIDSDQIESRGASKMEDIFRGLPGVEMQGGPRRTGQDINIRGFGGQRVVTTLDGARQNFDAGHKGRFFLDPDLLRQVEVVRGSNSALHGSGAIGGVVSMETKDASDFLDSGETVGFRTKYGYSSVQRENYYSAGAFGRIQDKVDLVANFSFRDSGTLQQGGGRDLDYSAADMHDTFLKATIRPNEFNKLSTSLIKFNEDTQAPTNLDAAPTSTSNPVVNRYTTMTTWAGTYNYSNPDVPLINPTIRAYNNQLDIREDRVIPATPARLDETSLTTWGFDAYNTARFATGSMQHAVTVGADYFNDDQLGLRNKAARSTFPSAGGEVTGYYLQDEITLLPGLTVSPAVRYDTYKRESATIPDFEESAVSPKIGATWQALNWLGFYGSYGKAFRAPSMTEAFVAGTHFTGNTFVSNPNLRPEKTLTAEGGVRLKFDNVAMPKDSLRLNTTYFHTKAEDLIELVVGSTTSTYTNIADATIQGIETELMYDTQRAFASIGGSRIRGDNNITNRPVDSIPADKVMATVGGKLPEYGLRFGYKAELVAEQDRVSNLNNASGVEATVTRTSGYTVHGVFMTWFPMQDWLDGFRVDAGIENMFDNTYRRHLSNLYEEGRDYRISVSYTKGF